MFSRLVKDYLRDDDYAAVQFRLAVHPEAGAVIPGSGGVRKLRVAAAGRGTRGGYRLIYFVRRANDVIWMLTIYPKNVEDSIPASVLRRIREEIEDG